MCLINMLVHTLKKGLEGNTWVVTMSVSGWNKDFNVIKGNLTVKSFSHVWFFMTPWTIESLEFSRPEYWSRYLFPSPGDLCKPEIEPMSPALQAGSLQRGLRLFNLSPPFFLWGKIKNTEKKKQAFILLSLIITHC